MRLSSADWLRLVLLSVLWAGSYVFFELLIPRLPLMTIVFGRLAIAALALQLVCAWIGRATRLSPPEWGRFAIMGLLNNIVPFGFIIFAQSQIAIGTAAIINALAPLLAAILAHTLTHDDKLTTIRLCGLICGFSGAACVIAVQTNMGGTGDAWIGVACALSAALSTAVASIYGRRFACYAPLQAATAQLTAAASLICVPMLIVDQPWRLPAPDMLGWVALIGVGLLSTAVAYILYFQLLGSAGAINTMIVIFLVPISAIALGHVLFGEPIPAAAIAGTGLLGIGLICLSKRRSRAWPCD